MAASGMKRLAAAQGKDMAKYDGSTSMPKGGRVQSAPKSKPAGKKVKRGGY